MAVTEVSEDWVQQVVKAGCQGHDPMNSLGLEQRDVQEAEEALPETAQEEQEALRSACCIEVRSRP